MNKTWFEMGEEEGRRKVLRQLLPERFGPLPPVAQQRLTEWPAERLEPLVTAVIKAQSLKEMGLED